MKQAINVIKERGIKSWRSGTPINEIYRVVGIDRKTFYKWRKRDAEGGVQRPLSKGYPHRLIDDKQPREKIMISTRTLKVG